MPERQCYFGAEIADMLGMSHDNLYRKGVLERLYAQGMPRSVTLGRIRIPKPAFDAWLNRDHPLAPKPPANDAIASPPLAHQSDDAQRTFLHRAYARSR